MADDKRFETNLLLKDTKKPSDLGRPTLLHGAAAWLPPGLA
ncbi:MAG: hypothetical protein ACR2IY_01615 [Rubrivivax sp.]|jgi:hypothetical protein